MYDFRERVRLEPNKSQTVLFKQFSGASRFVWNKSKALYETIWKTEGRYATIKDLMRNLQAILSNGVHFPNINKTRTVRILRKRLQRIQRQISRKYELNVVYKDGKKIYHKTSNIKKLERLLILINRRITNIRNTYMYGVVNSVLKTKADSIHLEDLNIKGMLQNPKIAKSIQEQNLNKFKQILTCKCEQNNIPLYLVDRWYPSSKLCSCCGWRDNNLKLTDRVFKCSNCGLVLDRGENASLNIANCPSSKLKRIA